ncbi:DUF1365 domain-containing protein [Vibrio cortegadensis]|uniref:DUF1365 domain-containing protein n=1 Tax=Vibrio cortegadensis TaxID=1328770 RepID=UPI00352C29EC
MSGQYSSQLMVGHVQHRRFSPVLHSLRYPLFMPCIDIDELPVLEKNIWGFGQRWWHWAQFRRSDYLGSGCLKKAVQMKVSELTGVTLSGKVLAICHLRYLGVYFSPVNFYYLFDEDNHWQYMLAEVSNTPWNERHYYAIPAEPGDNEQHWQHQKSFHVSPFNPMDQKYVWKLKPVDKRLMIHLECHRERKEFEATLAMKPQAFSSSNLIRLLIRTPVMAIKVVLGIYWHALKLWLKGAPFYGHSVIRKKATTQENNIDALDNTLVSKGKSKDKEKSSC